MGRKSQIPEIEAKIGKPLSQWLREHIAQGEQPGAMASELGMSQSGLYAYMKQAGLKETLKEAARAAKVEANPGELRAAFDKFIDSKKIAERAEATIINFERLRDNFLWWLDFTKRPQTIRIMTAKSAPDGKQQTTMEAFFLYLKETVVRWGGETVQERKLLSAAARKGYYKMMLTFCNWGMSQDPPLWDKNPMTGIDAPKVGKRLPEDMPDEQIAQLLQSFDLSTFEGIRDRCLAEVFLETGMRLNGVASMRVSQFDWKTGNGKVVEKGNKERMIQIPLGTCELIRKYLDKRAKLAKPEQDHLWISAQTGGQLGYEGIYGVVHGWQEIIPGVRIHPHLFRHIFARWCVERNMGIMDIMFMGGWASMSLVEHYASAYQAKMAWKKRAGASVVNDVLKKESGSDAENE